MLLSKLFIQLLLEFIVEHKLAKFVLCKSVVADIGFLVNIPFLINLLHYASFNAFLANIVLVVKAQSFLLLSLYFFFLIVHVEY